MVVLLFSLLPQVVLASARQMWYLDADEDTYPGWAEHIMLRSPGGEPLNSENDFIEVASESSVLWRTDEVAEADVSFGAGTWNGKMMLSADQSYNLSNIIIQLGYLDSSGFTMVGETTLNDGEVQSWGAFYEIEAGGFTVLEGSYLALKVINNDPLIVVDVRTGSSHNWIKTPLVGPNYPLPEIPALALFTTGLVCLGGYMVFRRWSIEKSSGYHSQSDK